MKPSITFRRPALSARAGAWLLVVMSAALTAYFAFEWFKVYSFELGCAFAVVAIGAELLKPHAVSVGFDALRRFDIVSAVGALLVAAAILAFAWVADLSFSAKVRSDSAADRVAGSEAAVDARADRARVNAELAGIKKARPVAELEALVARAPCERRVIVDMQGRRTVCVKDAALMAELGRAKRKAELEADLRTLAGKRGPKMMAADPGASAITLYARAAGAQWATGDKAADEVSVWLALVPVMVVQFGSAFGLWVAGLTGRVASNDNPLPRRSMVARVAGWARRLRRSKVAAQDVPETLVASVAGNSETERGGLVVQMPRPATRKLGLVERPRSVRQLPDDQQLVFEALDRLGGSAESVQALAREMRVHKGEASKRCAAVADLLEFTRDGRALRVTRKAS
jgi:hypothetical protein